MSLSWVINSHGLCHSFAVTTIGIVAAVCLGFSFVIFVYIGMMIVNLGVVSFVVLVFLFLPNWWFLHLSRMMNFHIAITVD